MMFLPYDTLVELPYKIPPADWVTELSGISPVATVAGQLAPPGHAYYKIMAGTTNDQYRQWCFDNKKACLPLNVIMVEVNYTTFLSIADADTAGQVTFGGTNAPICHGSGLSTTTLSDLVVEVQYVDHQGTLRTVNGKSELRAASGAFGLLGVVVSLTLQLDEMGVTDMMPVKVPMPLAIPPPKDYSLPHEVQKIIEKSKITPDQFAAAQRDFEKRCETDYYLEWFWFPYQDDCWVNTWSSTRYGLFDSTSADYPFTERPITEMDIHLKAYPGDGLLDGVKSQQVR